MSDGKNSCINQCAIDELIEYSMNVQECEDRAAEIRETIVKRRAEGITDIEYELALWRDEGIAIHNTYVHYAEFGKQKCVTEYLNEETVVKLAQDLAEAHKDEIDSKLIN